MLYFINGFIKWIFNTSNNKINIGPTLYNFNIYKRNLQIIELLFTCHFNNNSNTMPILHKTLFYIFFSNVIVITIVIIQCKF